MTMPPHRLRWAALRHRLENRPVKKSVFGGYGIRIDTLSKQAAAFLKSTPVYARGYKNAANPRVIHKRLRVADLPQAFEGYRILHITDLHLDSIPGLAQRAAALIRPLFGDRAIDACVLTGDYIDRHAGRYFHSIMPAMKALCSAMAPRDGIFGVLGNHDTWKMVSLFEAMGIQMLINETCVIQRAGATLAFTGLDDPNQYYTPNAVRALESGEADFKIALIHTPEFFEEATENGFHLYLTGHTHGGQISLPGGHPVVLPLSKGRQFYNGAWQFKNMTGYTGQGLGTVSIPIRFNTLSEITLIELCNRERTIQTAR